MNQNTPRDPKQRARKRSQEEPGAHSGAESPPARRSVRGTASTTERYRPEEGTAGSETLAGREAEESPPEDKTGHSEP
ncbi:hypothetical protein GCM10010381_53960 [Streptomyces xantholiticus]|nr:hypothetical protein GCM10010381_53960 [Streptomyces xantholiticus]